MKDVVIITPIYKRPEILALFLQGYERIRDRADLLCIRSLEDPFYDTNAALLLKYGVRSIVHPNENLGAKKNAGLNYILKNYSFKYLMDLGSDNLINPIYFDLLFPHGPENDYYTKALGLKHLYVLDYIKQEFYFIKDYAYENTYGAGRIYPRKVLKKDFWPLDNCGLDIGLENKHNLDIDVFYLGDEPLILDIKTPTNINPMPLIHSRNENPAKKIVNPQEIEHLKKTFGLCF